MKSERSRLKFIILISILIQIAFLPITFNLINNNYREAAPVSMINMPKLSAETEWVPNGTLIYGDPWTQGYQQICSDGLGGAIITWTDYRDGSADVYALRIDDLPYSNHPEDFNTYLDGSELISWTLFDDTTGGKYRVIANDTDGNFYVWVNWTSWNHNVPLNIPLNRTELGIFSYRIEFYDELNQYGIPDTIIVLIKAHPSEKAIPLGHYYLLFIILGVAAIIIVKKIRFQQKTGF